MPDPLKNSYNILKNLFAMFVLLNCPFRREQTESGKLRALRARVATCLASLRAHVPTCLACLPAHELTYLACLRAHVSTCLACSRANVSCVSTCSHDHVLMPYVLACQRA